jgi:hypothetical protein
VVPGFGVAGHGLPQQDVVDVGAVVRTAVAERRQQHRHQPHPAGGEEGQRAQPELATAGMQPDARPATQGGERDRQQHQQRDHAHALADRAEPRCRPAQRPHPPVRAAQRMAQQAIAGQRDPEHHQRIDLRLLRLPGELDGEQHRPTGIQADAPRPQPRAEVGDAPQRAQRREQRGQQEGDTQVAGQPQERRLQPHEQRRLVRIQLAAAMREQPVATFHHLLRDQREARLVRRPWIAQAQAGAEDQQGEQPEQPGVATGLGHRGIITTRGYALLSRA